MIEKLGITPGPWEYYEDENWIERRTSEYDGMIIVEFDRLGKPDDNDLRLISAAPDMLEALIYAGRVLLHHKIYLLELHKAIEKATGHTWEEVKTIIEAEK